VTLAAESKRALEQLLQTVNPELIGQIDASVEQAAAHKE